MFAYVRRDLDSSVYKEVSKCLEKRAGSWRKAGRNAEVFHLMLGDRNNLPFSRLGNLLFTNMN